jgi:Helix-turn-helix
VADPAFDPGADPIEVMPVVVLSQIFPARPSSIPDIRDFVRRCLAESPLTDQGNREVGETVFRALLDAAGPTGSIHVAFRIFPEHVEVDVLHSDNQVPARPAQPAAVPGDAVAPGKEAGRVTPTVRSAAASYWSEFPGPAGGRGTPAGWGAGPDSGAMAGAGAPAADGSSTDEPGEGPATPATPAEPVALGQPGQPATFAEWMSTALRREGLTQQAAARQLGVSVKTVSRWVGGTTEPRMRDLRRIQEIFGEIPIR